MDPARKEIGVAVNTEVQEKEEMEKKVYPQIRKMFEVERKGERRGYWLSSVMDPFMLFHLQLYRSSRLGMFRCRTGEDD